VRDYIGIIVEESLIDKSILKGFKIIRQEISPNLGWHLYMVEIPERDIYDLSKNIESNKWYMHFWRNREVIVVFKDKTFKFNYDDKKTWHPAVEHGLSIGIPKEQLDFPIEG
jgi:nitrogen fixation protein